jgi:hypothetical protein
MTVEGLDGKYGVLRDPDNTDDWERGRRPLSRVRLNSQVAVSLGEFSKLASQSIFRSLATAHTYIWAMDVDGTVFIAVEELAIIQENARFQGYPRRRGFQHPSENQKLGHPTLLDSGPARIAGELALDEAEDGSIIWILNVRSGRYCKRLPPNRSQIENVRELFEANGLEVTIDH